jgi:hypothetical protein
VVLLWVGIFIKASILKTIIIIAKSVMNFSGVKIFFADAKVGKVVEENLAFLGLFWQKKTCKNRIIWKRKRLGKCKNNCKN